MRFCGSVYRADRRCGLAGSARRARQGGDRSHRRRRQPRCAMEVGSRAAAERWCLTSTCSRCSWHLPTSTAIAWHRDARIGCASLQEHGLRLDLALRISRWHRTGRFWEL